MLAQGSTSAERSLLTVQATGTCDTSAMASSWRFATWNVDFFAGHAPRGELVTTRAPTVIAIQEAQAWKAEQIAEAVGGPTVLAHDLWPSAKRGWSGCALATSADCQILDAGVVEDLAKPQRSIWARVALPDGTEVTAVSWHGANRAGDGLQAKMEGFAAVSDWLKHANRPLVLGADINSWTDPVVLTPAVAGEEHAVEHAFVGPDPHHGLVDAWRQLLIADGRIESFAPDGPLAVSHLLRSGAGHRMDRIYASPDLRCVDGGYDLEGGRRAGSDHALHWIDFEYPD